MKRLLAAALLTLASSAAYAADMQMESAPAAYNWSGAYVGGQVGYLFESDSRLFYSDNSADGDIYGYDAEPDGFFGGVQLGYNHQFSNNFVLGAETDIVFGGMDGSALYDESGVIFAQYAAEVEVKWSGSTRLRAGYAFDRFLPYVTAGVAYGHFETIESDSGVNYWEGDGTLVGWTAGVGLNYALTEKWVLGAEYRYTDFGSESFDATYISGAGFYSNETVDLKTHDVRMSLSYRF